MEGLKGGWVCRRKERRGGEEGGRENGLHISETRGW